MAKKIGIITQHRVVNYGSMLQAYALQEKLVELGCESEIIDYYPERFTPIGMLKRIKEKSDKLKKHLSVRTAARIIIIPSYFIRFKMFFAFMKSKMNLTEKVYRTEEELNAEQFDYDVYCTGSDLSFAPDSARKISYAASFGKNELSEDEVEETKALLERYDAISLREISGVEILKGLGIDNAVNVLDPTLLLNGGEWRKISSKRFDNEEYIFVYNLNRNKVIDDYAENLSKKTGLKVKYISYQLHEAFRNGKMYCNPKVEDFLSLIDNAKYVVTDSFHATAFSLNFNTEFVIVYPGKYNTRLQSILEITGLTNRVAKNNNDLGIIENKIDFTVVNQILDSKREESLDWLNKAVN